MNTVQWLSLLILSRRHYRPNQKSKPRVRAGSNAAQSFVFVPQCPQHQQLLLLHLEQRSIQGRRAMSFSDHRGQLVL